MQRKDQILQEAELRIASDGVPRKRGSFTRMGIGDQWDAAQPAPRNSNHAEQWSLNGFFDARTNAAVADALRPEALPEDPGEELSFVKAIGQDALADADRAETDVAQQLLARGLHQKLAKQIVRSAKKLAEAAAAAGGELNAKFMAQGGLFEFDYGDKSDYSQGLEARIGSPIPDTMKGLVQEHCAGVDSNKPWTTGNYGITSCPLTEFLFVVDQLLNEQDQAFRHLLDANLDAQLIQGLDRLRELWKDVPRGSLPQDWPSETVNGQHPREQNRSKEWLKYLVEKNKMLREAGEKPLFLEEAIALCLYTGPLFEKYNAVCRGGSLNKRHAIFNHAKFLDMCCGDTRTEDKANRYVTTIHLATSGLVKLSKLSKAETVMRGTAGGLLPYQFWEEDATGVRGGVEYGFLSTTTDLDVAKQCAGGSRGAGTVYKMQTGMIDKGADIGWISQYPLERELCFPPLTCLQVIGTSVEGSVLVMSIRLNLNLTSSTIDEVIGKRWKISKETCMNLRSEAANEMRSQLGDQFKDEQGGIMEVLDMALSGIHERPAEYFNKDEHFQQSLKAALEWKKVALRAAELAAAGSTSDAIEAYGPLLSHARSCIECGSKAEVVVGLLLRLAQGASPHASKNVLASIASGNRNLEELIAHAMASGPQVAGQSIEVLRKAWNSRASQAAREQLAALALALAGAPEEVGEAMELVSDLVRAKEWCVRHAACGPLAALAKAGGPEVVGKAMELLPELARDEDPQVRKAACGLLAALARAGSPEVVGKAMELLPDLARDEVWDVRKAACRPLAALAEAGGPEVFGKAMELLPEMARDKVQQVRKAACGLLAALARAGSPEVVGKAMELLPTLARDENRDVRVAVCRQLAALAKAGGPEVVGKAMELLSDLAQGDQFWQVREAACEQIAAVAMAGGSEVVGKAMELLPKLAWDQDLDVRTAWAVCRQLAALAGAGDPEVFGKAMELLSNLAHQDENENVGQAARGSLAALAKAGGPEVVGKAMEVLPNLAWDEDLVVRTAACGPLAAIALAGGPKVIGKAMQLLSDLSQDEVWQVREAACGSIAALATAGGPEVVGTAIELLPEMARDEVSHVRIAACGLFAALAEAGGPEEVGKVMELLPDLARDKVWDVRGAACRPLAALGEAGGPDVVGKAMVLLSDLARDEDEEIRDVASNALAGLKQA